MANEHALSTHGWALAAGDDYFLSSHGWPLLPAGWVAGRVEFLEAFSTQAEFLDAFPLEAEFLEV